MYKRAGHVPTLFDSRQRQRTDVVGHLRKAPMRQIFSIELAAMRQIQVFQRVGPKAFEYFSCRNSTPRKVRLELFELIISVKVQLQ